MTIENPQELMSTMKQLFNEILADIIVEDPDTPNHYMIDPTRQSEAMEELASLVSGDSSVAVFSIPILASLSALWLARLCDLTGLAPTEYTYALSLDLLTRE